MRRASRRGACPQPARSVVSRRIFGMVEPWVEGNALEELQVEILRWREEAAAADAAAAKAAAVVVGVRHDIFAIDREVLRSC